MNNATPPSPYYDGITFNPVFFLNATTTADAVTGITQAQADVRYLIKGSPDTATAQETFQGGIITSTAVVNKITSTNNNPSLFNDTAATAAYTNVQLVNAQDTQILIGNSQVTAPMDIANGATRTGNLNICNGLSSASTVSICDKGAGQVNMTGFVFTLASIIYNTVATSINLFNTTTGTVSLGAWKFLNQTLNPNNVASAVSICNSNTTGALTIGSNTMTGNISVLSAGAVNIATSATNAGAINIGNITGQTSTISIGGQNTMLSLQSGTLTITNTGIPQIPGIASNISPNDILTVKHFQAMGIGGVYSAQIWAVGGNPTVNYTVNTGYYNRVGNMCFVCVNITTTSYTGGASAGNVGFSLPFTVNSPGPKFPMTLGLTSLSSTVDLVLEAVPNAQYCLLYYKGASATAYTVAPLSFVPSSCVINFSGWFMTT